MINIELFSVGSHGEFYLNIVSYVSCIIRHFVDYGIPLSQIKIVLFILTLHQHRIYFCRPMKS